MDTGWLGGPGKVRPAVPIEIKRIHTVIDTYAICFAVLEFGANHAENLARRALVSTVLW